MSGERPNFPNSNQSQTEAQKAEQEKRQAEDKNFQILMQEGAAELSLDLQANWFYRIDEDDPNAPHYPQTQAINGIRTGNATIPAEKLKLTDGDYQSNAFPGAVLRLKNGVVYPLPGARIIEIPPLPPTGIKEFREAYLPAIKMQYAQGCRTLEITYEHSIDVRLQEINELMKLAQELGMKVSFNANVQRVINTMRPQEKAKVDNFRKTLDVLYQAKLPMRDGAERDYIFQGDVNKLASSKTWEEQYPEIANKTTKAEKEAEFIKQLCKTPTGSLPPIDKLKKIENEIQNMEARRSALTTPQDNLKSYKDSLKEALEKIEKRKDNPNLLSEYDDAIAAEQDPAKKEQLQKERLIYSVDMDATKLSEARDKNQVARDKLIDAIDKELNDLSAREAILRDEVTKIKTEMQSKSANEANRQEVLDISQRLLDGQLNNQTGDLSKAIQKSKSDFSEVKNDDKEMDRVIKEQVQQVPVVNPVRPI